MPLSLSFTGSLVIRFGLNLSHISRDSAACQATCLQRASSSALNDKIDALQTQVTALQDSVTLDHPTYDEMNAQIDQVRAQSANNVDGMDTDNDTLNDPPTFDDVDNLRNKLNELINGLRR